ncbi:alanine racemase, partial [Thioclava sp. BHET1]
LGMEEDEWAAIAPIVLEAGPELVMSHLACADAPDHEMNARQLAAFHHMTDGLGMPRSLAATGGILLGAEYHFDLTRPGIGLYGGLPFAEARAAVRLSLPIIQTRRVSAGESVGYGNAWIAETDSTIATISAGYADGLHRTLSNTAVLWDIDTPCPLVGRVSMDLLTVDITHLPEIPRSLDLIGAMQGVDLLADQAGTIGYEILTGLGRRYTAQYSGGNA